MITQRKRNNSIDFKNKHIARQILYTQSQEASLQILIKSDLNTVPAKAVESTSWLIKKEHKKGILLYTRCPPSCFLQVTSLQLETYQVPE